MHQTLLAHCRSPAAAHACPALLRLGRADGLGRARLLRDSRIKLASKTMSCLVVGPEPHSSATFGGSCLFDDWCSGLESWAPPPSEEGGVRSSDVQCGFSVCEDNTPPTPELCYLVDVPDSPPTTAPSSPTAKDRVDDISVSAQLQAQQ